MLREQIEFAYRGDDPLDERSFAHLAATHVDVHAEITLDQIGVEPRAGIATRLADDPIAHGQNRAALLGNGHEVAGHQQTALRVVPTK